MLTFETLFGHTYVLNVLGPHHGELTWIEHDGSERPWFNSADIFDPEGSQVIFAELPTVGRPFMYQHHEALQQTTTDVLWTKEC